MTHLDHIRQNRLRADERTRQIDIDDLIPLINRHINHRNPLDDTGVVDEDVNRTKLLLHIRNKLLNLIFLRHIANAAISVNALSLVSLNAALYQLLLTIIEDDLGTCLGQSRRIRKTKTIGTARDPGNLAINTKLIENTHFLITSIFFCCFTSIQHVYST